MENFVENTDALTPVQKAARTRRANAEARRAREREHRAVIHSLERIIVNEKTPDSVKGDAVTLLARYQKGEC